MPTFGCNFEDIRERFWEVQEKLHPIIDPPLDFTSITAATSPIDSRQPQGHSIVASQLKLPTLMVHSAPIPKETVRRTSVEEQDVTLAHCSRCDVVIDVGRPQVFTPTAFRSWFAHMRHAVCTVRLVSDSSTAVVEEYRIHFSIPDTSALSTVDAHFIHTLVVRELTHHSLEEFSTGLSIDGPAREYADALGNYALGIILKEGRGHSSATRMSEDFEGKMRSALEILRHFKSPVAMAVCSSIYFNLNNFRDNGAADATELDVAMQFFRNIADPVVVETSRASRAVWRASHQICPIDRVSHYIRLACDHLASGGRLSLDQITDLWRLTSGSILISSQDLAKIHVVCAEGYVRLDRPLDALPHVYAMQHHPLLGNWAERCRKDLSSNERETL